jgi:predicted enzyme related to lactoylglutathione lyase
MSENDDKNIGAIAWVDLTVMEANRVREFYSSVVGWESAPVSMGDYDDFNMISPGQSDPTAGICHARGVNADLPAQWMIYITVEDVDKSAEQCMKMGGKVLVGPKNMGPGGRYCVIQDPAGAVAALYSTRE